VELGYLGNKTDLDIISFLLSIASFHLQTLNVAQLTRFSTRILARHRADSIDVGECSFFSLFFFSLEGYPCCIQRLVLEQVNITQD
jgi:hypothetical protein